MGGGETIAIKIIEGTWVWRLEWTRCQIELAFGLKTPLRRNATRRGRERESDSIMETTDFQALKVIDLKCSWHLCEILWQFMATYNNYSLSMINWSRSCRSLFLLLSLSSHAFELPLSAFSFSIHSGTKAQRTHFVRLVVCFGHWRNSKLPMAN